MRSLIKNVWKRAGIIEAIEKGLSELPSVDPFQSIDPLVHQVDFFLTQDTTSIYSSLDSDQLQAYTLLISQSQYEGEW